MTTQARKPRKAAPQQAQPSSSRQDRQREQLTAEELLHALKASGTGQAKIDAGEKWLENRESASAVALANAMTAGRPWPGGTIKKVVDDLAEAGIDWSPPKVDPAPALPPFRGSPAVPTPSDEIAIASAPHGPLRQVIDRIDVMLRAGRAYDTPSDLTSSVDEACELVANVCDHDSSLPPQPDVSRAFSPDVALARLRAWAIDADRRSGVSAPTTEQPAGAALSVGAGAETTQTEPGAPYMPASWFKDEFGTTADALYGQKRRENLRARKRGHWNEYSVPDAKKIWPAEVTYGPDGSDR